MKKINLLSILTACCLCMIGCDKDENAAPSQASLTSPLDKSTTVGLLAELTWAASIDEDGDKVAYDVYLGPENNPVTKVADMNASNSFTANDLTNNSTYYWKVVSKDDAGKSSESETWSFETNAILGDWESTPTEIVPDIMVVQTFTFDADGTGTSEQTGDITNSFILNWSTTGSDLEITIVGHGKDTLYHTFENNGHRMIFKESEVTPDITMTLNRKTE